MNDAVAAAVRIAEKHGLDVQEPVLLRSTNNVVAWLAPSPVVAKIAAGHRRRLQTELCVSSELRALGARVVPPASEVPAVVHVQEGFEVTFWRYYPQPLDQDSDVGVVGEALHHLHATGERISAAIRASLPSYDAELASVSELLADRTRLRRMPLHDRRALIGVCGRLRKRLETESRPDTYVMLHGSPHPYNVLLVDGKPCFVDFEDACIGPVEWDLAHTSPESVNNYSGDVDRELLGTCRNLVRVKTAAWCWAHVSRGDLRDHAEIHVKALKKSFGGFF